ncbi:hypothetical protein [Rubinisphaera italica]|nr:hypothetical protein [Rubinisphaera italica]
MMFETGNPGKATRIVMVLNAALAIQLFQCVSISLAQSTAVEIIEADRLNHASDEFNDPETLADWQRIFQTEQTEADQLQSINVGKTKPGWMTLIPHTSTWYQDYRGVLVFKEITGNFVVTTRAEITNRDRSGAPRSQFSLGGLMVRSPRHINSRTWRPGGENYLFLSLGTANKPGEFAFEVKTTRNSDSQLKIEPLSTGVAEIRIARLGSHFLLLRRLPNSQWMVHRRYHRPDMPESLQVGFTVYTDYPSASKFSPAQQNSTVIRSGRPDLIASFEYFRIREPIVPAEFADHLFTDARSISDAELLSFLGNAIK